jgi:predicted Rossmann fold flavoprotein
MFYFEPMQFDLIVVGGGAAGFYGAIQAATTNPSLRIVILEKTQKLLTKVKVSGGGRCNVTHACHNPFELARHYPRGEKMLKQSFKEYHADHVVDWFTSRGVELKTESDGRMFPTTDNSQTIIDCFVNEAARLKIQVVRGVAVTSATRNDGFTIHAADGRSWTSNTLLIAIGGHNNSEAYNWIRALGHSIVPPIPSLFTFNDKEGKFKDLMGIAVPMAELKIATTKFSERGPLLITHWGLSGPAVIKLSAWAADYLHTQKYLFEVRINWTGETDVNCREALVTAKNSRGKQKMHGNQLFSLPQRLWVRLCEFSEIEPARMWSEASNRELNKLAEHLLNTTIRVSGKTTFKEEFVTCGGVDVREVNPVTLESKLIPRLFFAGEVLNVDGETGGFNFQAAWSTSYLAAMGIAKGGN